MLWPATFRLLEAIIFLQSFLGSSAPAPSPNLSVPSYSQEELSTKLFQAIADFDSERLRQILNAGANPNCELPHTKEADALRARFPDGHLYYYLHCEPGYTALMFASAIGNATAVRFLLIAGAQLHRTSRRSETFALWQAAKGGHIEVMKILMGIKPGSQAEQYRVEVNLATQQAIVMKDNVAILTTKISSGKSSTPTRPGRYLVTDKYRSWKSTIYPARMPFFLRLSCGDFGLHAGVLPGHPASHGCVRLPTENAKQLYSMLPIGTLVEIR